MLNTETATVAGGCFWCTEAIFLRLEGVLSVTPGYAGGNTPHPTYEQVCSGRTGHVEAVQILFDPTQISYETLLDVFWHTHDPTTENRQGNDVGEQYQSVVFTHSKSQKEIAIAMKKALTERHDFPAPIVTKITDFSTFYPAEDYHKNYYEKHKDQAYCNMSISPKIEKLETSYAPLLRDKEKTLHI